MSFLLTAINSKKDNLKPTETVVTCVDGRKYVQTKNSEMELEANSYGFVVDTKPDDIPAKVLDYLYLGSQDCCELHVLMKYNIKYVLSIGVDAPVKHPHVKQYKFVECLDLPETNIMEVLNICNEFIKSAIEKHSNVLVHCNAGVSRSSSVIIGYLILEHNYSYVDAFNAVKGVRTCIKPNTGFQLQLQRLSRF